MNALWICGEFDPECVRVWYFCGVFSTEQAANDACLSELHFIAPAWLDQADNGPRRDWQGLYQPRAAA